MEISQTRKGELYIYLGNLLWAFFPIVTILTLSTLAPFVAQAWSTMFAAIFLGGVLLFTKKFKEVTNTSAWPDILIQTILIGVGYYALFFWGLKFTTAGNAAIIALTETFFAFILYHLFLKEKITSRHFLGIMLMVTGALIVLLPDWNGFNPGDFLILIASAIAPIATIYQRQAMKKVSSQTVMFLRSLITFPIMLIIAWLVGDQIIFADFKASFWFLLLNGVLLLGLSKIFWLEAIHRIPVAKTNALGALTPLLTLFFAFLILKEVPTPWQLLSLVPLFFGVILLTTNTNIYEKLKNGFK